MSDAIHAGDEAVRREDVTGRHEAGRLAATDVRGALAVARAIRHPWYRCQALAHVATRVASPGEQDAVLREAVDAATMQREPNRVAWAASWPLRVMVAFDRPAAAALVRRLLRAIAAEPHGLRRLDGLAAILGAVLAHDELRAMAMRPFLETAAVSSGWRTERIVARMATGLAARDREAATSLLDSRPSNRFAIRARADIEEVAANGGSLGWPIL